MDRITVRDAERQAARLAKAMGHQFHYVYARKGDERSPDMAEGVPCGTVGAWVLDKSAAGGWINLYQYSNAQGGLSHAVNLDAMKPAEMWNACRFALDVLQRMSIDA